MLVHCTLGTLKRRSKYDDIPVTRETSIYNFQVYNHPILLEGNNIPNIIVFPNIYRITTIPNS